MIENLGNLPQWFGFIGLLSVALWLAAVVFMLTYLFALRMRMLTGAAVLCAVVGLVVAQVNSQAIRNIQPDYSAQEAALAKQKQDAWQAKREQLMNRAADIQFAEDDAMDRLDLAGVEQNTAKNVYEQALEQNQAQLSFRDRGKRERKAGVQREGGASEIINQQNDEAGEVEAEVYVKKLLPDQLAYADRADVLNLAVSRSVVLLAVLFLIGDYLRRFGQPFASVQPLPIAGRWLSWSGRSGRAMIVQHAQADLLPWYRRQVVGKGETFIDFGGASSNQPLYRFAFDDDGFCPVPRIRVDEQSDASLLEDAFESAWFGRAVVSITDRNVADRAMQALIDWLERRSHASARAWQGVHVIWRFEQNVDRAMAQRLVWLCQQTGLTLLVVGQAALPGVDQVYTSLSAPRPTVMQRALASVVGIIQRMRPGTVAILED